MTAYIPYFVAKELLASRLQATPDEIAQWIFFGKDTGGLNAYRTKKFDNEPKPFNFNDKIDDYISQLLSVWFLRNEIEKFTPDIRYITRKALVERWTMQCGGKFKQKDLLGTKWIICDYLNIIR